MVNGLDLNVFPSSVSDASLPSSSTFTTLQVPRMASLSVGWTAGGPTWIVSGANGENRTEARGPSLAEAYWRACQQARAGTGPSDGAPGIRPRSGTKGSVPGRSPG